MSQKFPLCFNHRKLTVRCVFSWKVLAPVHIRLPACKFPKRGSLFFSHSMSRSFRPPGMSSVSYEHFIRVADWRMQQLLFLYPNLYCQKLFTLRVCSGLFVRVYRPWYYNFIIVIIIWLEMIDLGC